MEEKKAESSENSSSESAGRAAVSRLIRAQTRDGFDNFISRLGLNNDNTLSAGTYTYNLVTRNRVLLETAYRGSWIVGAVVDSVAQDMTRAGITITSSESKEKVPEMYAAMSRLKIWQALSSNEKWGRLYGGSLGVLQIEGQDTSTPLDLSTIKQGQFKGIVIYDRWMLQPVLTPLIPSGPDMGLPMLYQIVTAQDPARPGQPMAGEPATSQGIMSVHHTRVVRSGGITLPFFQAITEQLWGESVLERLWDRLISFDNVTLSAASLVDRANLRTVHIKGLREVIAAGGPAYEGLLQFFDLMRSMQTNEGLTLLDEEDEFSTSAYTFSGLSDMMLQFGQQLSGACEIPLMRLFGQAPAGLGDTGDSVMRTYYDSIAARQEAELRNPVETILKVMWVSTFGVPAPIDMQFKFNPLWQMSAVDKANVAKTITETSTAAFNAGLVDRSTAMKELRDSSANTGIFSNIADDVIASVEGEELQASQGERQAEATEAMREGGGDEGDKGAKPSKKKFGDSIRRLLSRKKTGDAPARPCVVLVGSPASGKSWVSGQLASKFTVLEQDEYIGQGGAEAYLEDVEKSATDKPLLLNTPFGYSTLRDQLVARGFIPTPVFIVENEIELKRRYAERGGRALPQGHLTRQKTYLDRAKELGAFVGNSSEVLAHLKEFGDVSAKARQ